MALPSTPRVVTAIFSLSLAIWHRKNLDDLITQRITGSPLISSIVIRGALGLAILYGLFTVQPVLKFVWACFIKPIGKVDQTERLHRFYESQADIYDATRNGLLRGRETMLALCASHLQMIRSKNPSTPLIWIDIGGGTGYNIEQMDKFLPISTFEHVYLVDLCEPLLRVARERFERRGWKNITVLCQDASNFDLPFWKDKDVKPEGSISLATLSYSLSMIPNFYLLLDRLNHVLSPTDGIIGVVDFYASNAQLSLHERAIGGSDKQCSWFTRWFWQIWFDFDHVSLSPYRRNYLEYKFGTIKSYNGRNRYILPFIVRIPYYIWIGRSRSCDVSAFCHAFEVEGGNMIRDGSPIIETTPPPYEEVMPPLEIGEASQPLLPQQEFGRTTSLTRARKELSRVVSAPLSSFHYQLKHPWRLPYYDDPVHKEFRTFIYSFNWEDPVEDMKYLALNEKDSMFVITSAGDNALHYAINAKPKRIHCVDMNPCQGHLLELKLAAMLTVEYKDFFNLFGMGKHRDFRTLLDTKIAPLLSSNAYQFWRLNQAAFNSSFYMRGYAGWALRLSKWMFWLTGVSKDAKAICMATTIEEQERIWKERLRPVIMNKLVVSLLKNPVFCWNALGVPMNQRRMFLNEGSAYEFIRDTMEPLASHSLFSRSNYFYFLSIMGRYDPLSCPDYLTEEGFNKMRESADEIADSFRLHTGSIMQVLSGLKSSSITKAVIMDHLDWFNPQGKEVTEEVAELYRVLVPGGLVLWRSAGKQPWYNEHFAKKGFVVTAIGMRDGSGKALDRVNMYASCWIARKCD